MPSSKSPKAKPVASPKPAAKPKKDNGGCLRRVGLPLALLFGGCLLLSVIASAVQNVGERVGLLPTSTPSPTPTVTLTPSATPTATAMPVPSATPTVTDTPLATDTPALTDTAMPTNTPAPTDTATQPPPTVTNTPAPTATSAPTNTPAPTSTPTPAPLAQRSEAIALPLESDPAVPATTTDANLRSGPGQQYTVVGGTVTGQRLEDDLAPVGQSADGGWLALADGSWIAASLVAGAPSGLAVVNAPAAPTAQVTEAEPVATAAPETAAPAATTSAQGVGIESWTHYTCENNPAPPPDPACVIKGNISSEHIYHVPGQRDYCKTEIDESKGERWFCTTQEAEAAGWRAAQR